MQVIPNHTSYTNVHPIERWFSVLAGAAVAASAFRAKSKTGALVQAAVAAGMIKRGVTGRCAIYKTLGIHTAPSNAALPYELGIRVDAAVTVRMPRDQVFQFWRKLENLPRFMQHLISVQQTEGGRSHWIAEGPAGHRIEWDAQIINEIQNELIAWKSLPGSEVQSAGSVHFSDAPEGLGTEIRVELQYNPPAGTVGAYVAKLMGREPEQEIQIDLQTLKHVLEGGETPESYGARASSSLDEVVIS